MAKNDSHPSNTPALPRLQWRTAALLFWPIAIGGFIGDLWTKSAAADALHLKIATNAQFVVTGIILPINDRDELNNVTLYQTPISDLVGKLFSEDLYNYAVNLVKFPEFPFSEKDSEFITFYYDKSMNRLWEVSYTVKHKQFEKLQLESNKEVVIIPKLANIIFRENEGAAFSIFQGWTGFLILISVIALLAEIGLFFSGVIRHKLVMFAMGCTAGGIAGNLYDRLFNEGRVRDFIDVYVGTHHWPTFNVADTLLCIGVGLIIISNLTSSTDKSVQ